MKPAHTKTLRFNTTNDVGVSMRLIFFSSYAIFLGKNRNRTCGCDVIKISQFYAEPTQKSIQLKNAECGIEKESLCSWRETERERASE